jgi:hypothetical protein
VSSNSPESRVCVHQADANLISVSGDVSQGLGVAISLGGGKFGEYLRTTSFPASCERKHVHFAGTSVALLCFQDYSICIQAILLTCKLKR